MTMITLKFWSANSGTSSNPLIAANTRERVYVQGERGETLGYFELREHAEERGSDSYYDAHRRSKGDTAEVVTDSVAWNGPAGMDAAILAAVATQRPALLAELRIPSPADAAFGDDRAYWFRRHVAVYAQGGFPPYFGVTPAPKRRLALKARDAARYEIA